jgi:hypothetical protein
LAFQHDKGTWNGGGFFSCSLRCFGAAAGYKAIRQGAKNVGTNLMGKEVMAGKIWSAVINPDNTPTLNEKPLEALVSVPP